MAHSVIEVHPEEIKQEEIDFTADLPNDTSFTINATASDTAGDAASIVASTSTSGMIGYVTLSGMVDGEDYLVFVGATGDTTALEVIKVIEVRARSIPGMF